jgi:hypothetical protein
MENREKDEGPMKQGGRGKGGQGEEMAQCMHIQINLKIHSKKRS